VTKYTLYVSDPRGPLWELIVRWHPHVDEENAKRIANEALDIPVSATERNRASQRSWAIAKHVWDEAKKLKHD